MHIENSYIRVEPRPTGMSHLFYSFPVASFFALNSFFVSFFLLSSCCMVVVRVIKMHCVCVSVFSHSVFMRAYVCGHL